MDDPLELGHLTDKRPPFKYAAYARVWFSDTDAQGIVYYGRYLPYFDHARTEYHRHVGGLVGSQRSEEAERSEEAGRAELVMRASHVDYLAPARFDDLIEAFVRVSRIGRTSITYEFSAWRMPDELLLVEATQTLVLVDRAERRPTPIPDSSRVEIRAFEGSDLEE